MTNSYRPEASTPHLDAFLDGLRPRKLSDLERAERLRYWMSPETDRAALRPETKPQRIMVMWRVVRATAMLKGLCAEEETLDEATEVSPDPWTTPFAPVMAPTARAALRRQRAARLLALHAEGGGLPLLPPRTRPDALERWCAAASIIARDLGIDRHPDGLAGLEGLLLPKEAAESDVTDGEVIAFEDMAIEETLNLMLDVGERAAVKHWRDQYGLARKEAEGLLRLAKGQVMARTAASLEEKRALQEARLEEFLGRAKAALNMDDEMKALKELARVQGLTRSDPEDQGREFLEVVKRVSRDQDAKLADATVRLLPRDEEEVQPMQLEAHYDPEDEEALREYDRENQHR